jgi:tetratricopeptide (TPR) repeat protein
MAFNNHGNAHEALGQVDQALADYSSAIALDHRYAHAYYNRGSTHLAARRHALPLRTSIAPSNSTPVSCRPTSTEALREWKVANWTMRSTISLPPFPWNRAVL